MSTTLLVVLTVIEIVVLVAVLALFLILITRKLRSVADALEQLSGGTMGGDIGRIQGNVLLLGAGSAFLTRKLDAIAGATPIMAERAESKGSQAGRN